jgi:hypothetical protein
MRAAAKSSGNRGRSATLMSALAQGTSARDHCGGVGAMMQLRGVTAEAVGCGDAI